MNPLQPLEPRQMYNSFVVEASTDYAVYALVTYAEGKQLHIRSVYMEGDDAYWYDFITDEEMPNCEELQKLYRESLKAQLP